jgi:predicted transposase YbfD/YdcC
MPAGDVAWPWLRQWCRITRTRIDKRTRKETTEVAYAISSLPTSMTTPKQMLALNRGHWGIENRLHWLKDTLLREDASTVRTKNAPQAIAALRNTALYLLHNIHTSTIIAREKCTRKPHIAIKQCFMSFL